MFTENRGKTRSLFVATAVVVELQSNTCLTGRTSDLSLSGCYFDTLNPLPLATAVQVRLTHKNDLFTALGVVVRSQTNLGMGIKFTLIEAEQQPVLEKWLAEMNWMEFNG
jgi:PilZ domain